MTTTARRKAYRMGHAAEWRAVWRLRLGGYTILMRRYKTRLGEIDIVARRGNVLAFVEVKARADFDDAAYAVTPRQQQRIIAAAQAWLMHNPDHERFDLRFDAILVAPGRLPRHLTAAFDASP